MPQRDEVQLTGYALTDKKPRVRRGACDSRVVGGWEVNASAAVPGGPSLSLCEFFA